MEGELGITGTTAKEAMFTISGSASATKSAWSNLITGIADDNADFDQLVNNLVDSLIGTVDESGERVGGLIDRMVIGHMASYIVPPIAIADV